MIPELDTALVARLRGTDIVPVSPMVVPMENILKNTQTQPTVPFNTNVNVTMQIPDEWFAQTYLPAVNIWRLDLRYNPPLFRVGQHIGDVIRDDGSGLDLNFKQQKTHQLPFRATYEVGIRTRFQLQLVKLIEEVQRRFPPMGFGSFVTVGLEDGDVQVPFQQTSYVDLTNQQNRSEREFEARFTYEMDIWMDVGTWTAERTIRTVVLTTYVPGAATPVTPLADDPDKYEKYYPDSVTIASG